MAAEQAAENHVDDRGLTWYFRRGIYTSIPTLTHPQISLAAVEALRWSSLKWSERASQSVLVISFAMKQDMCFEFIGKSMETERTWAEFSSGGKPL